jgi:hypothetical protein
VHWLYNFRIAPPDREGGAIFSFAVEKNVVASAQNQIPPPAAAPKLRVFTNGTPKFIAAHVPTLPRRAQ